MLFLRHTHSLPHLHHVCLNIALIVASCLLTSLPAVFVIQVTYHHWTEYALCCSNCVKSSLLVHEFEYLVPVKAKGCVPNSEFCQLEETAKAGSPPSKEPFITGRRDKRLNMVLLAYQSTWWSPCSLSVTSTCYSI